MAASEVNHGNSWRASPPRPLVASQYEIRRASPGVSVASDPLPSAPSPGPASGTRVTKSVTELASPITPAWNGTAPELTGPTSSTAAVGVAPPAELEPPEGDAVLPAPPLVAPPVAAPVPPPPPEVVPPPPPV